MKIAIIGTRSLTVNNIGEYLPPEFMQPLANFCNSDIMKA